MIPLTVPLIEEDDITAVAAVLRTGHLVQGASVAEFESAVSSVVGVAHAIAVSSGTAALHLALLALGIGRGDFVAVPTYSWPSTANVVEAVGARCVFVDIDENTWAMSAESLAGVDDDLAAVIPVHPFGAMADLSDLSSVAPGIPMVEDAACALGAVRDGRTAGSVGVIGCFSFHPRKAVTTGEGGVLTTSSAELAGTLRSWRNHGIDATSTPADFRLAGLNYRLTDIQGALGVSQMSKFERVTDARRMAARRYDDLLEATPVRAPVAISGSSPVFQSYVALLPEGVDRLALIETMARCGVQTQIGTIAIPFTDYYQRAYGPAEGRFPVTERLAGRALSLPLYPGITLDDQRRVVELLVESL